MASETTRAQRYLYGKLSGVVSAGKAYPGVAPRGATMPYILYQYMPSPDDGQTTTVEGSRVLTKLTYLVKVVADTIEQAQPIVDAADAALTDPSGLVVDGLRVSNVRQRAPFEMPTVEGDTLYWQIGGYYTLEVTSAA